MLGESRVLLKSAQACGNVLLPALVGQFLVWIRHQDERYPIRYSVHIMNNAPQRRGRLWLSSLSVAIVITASGIAASIVRAEEVSPRELVAGPVGVALSAAYEPPEAPPADSTAQDSASTGLFGPSGKRYGQAGAKAWTLGGLYANDFQQSNDLNIHVDYSYFLADHLEFAVELGGWYFRQPGEDTGGVSASMIFRWHLWHADDYDWSVFLDAGIGLLGGFDEVPDGGTGINFMPRLGAGFTTALGDNTDGRSPRLMVGARWHHISNARIEGDGRNPGRDGIAAYVAIVFPF